MKLAGVRRAVLPGLVFAFPILYYFQHVFPNSGLLSLHNDFRSLYFIYKAYLLDLWAHGHFPYWSPGEACGFGFFGNPFTAIFYPPNLLLLLVRLATGRYGLWFHQIFTILGVSWFALGLYSWLRRSFAHPAAAAFSAMAISTCWMVSEFLRFPNAIHALAWLPWGLRALHAVHHELKLRHVYAGVFAIVCQTTAGYPYFVVYSYLFYAGYLAFLHWRSPAPDFKWRLGFQAATLAIPALLTLPYTNAISHQMAATTDRNGGVFSYATEHPYGPIDFIGSLVFPPVSSVEGCFYMSSLAVFLVALFFWRGKEASEKVAVLLGILGFASLIFNFRSFLFFPIWSVVPVLNQMRVFGRMATMLLPLMAIALHHGFALLAEQLAKPVAERDLTMRAVWGIFGAIFLIQGYLYAVREPLNGHYAMWTAPNLPGGSREIDFLMFTVLSAAVVSIVLHVEWSKVRWGTTLCFAALIWLVAQDTGTQGRYVWTQLFTSMNPSLAAPGGQGFPRRLYEAAKAEGNLYRLIHEYFELDRTPEVGELLSTGLSRGLVANWDYQRYTDFINRWGSDTTTMNQLLGVRKLFFHTSLTADPKAFLADAQAAEALAETPRAVYFNGSELEVEVRTRHPGYLAWIDNWAAGWAAQLDGASSKIDVLLGTFKTVKLATPGVHTVRFRYRPIISTGAYVASGFGLLALLLLPLHSRVRWRAVLGRPGSRKA